MRTVNLLLSFVGFFLHGRPICEAQRSSASFSSVVRVGVDIAAPAASTGKTPWKSKVKVVPVDREGSGGAELSRLLPVADGDDPGPPVTS